MKSYDLCNEAITCSVNYDYQCEGIFDSQCLNSNNGNHLIGI
jgi:hypothetical protein